MERNWLPKIRRKRRISAPALVSFTDGAKLNINNQEKSEALK